MKRVVLFVGGVGGAKLALGMYRVLPPEALTVIVNNGDDFWHYGLRVCPDTDTLLYTLSGRVDPVNGWGIAGDTTVTLDALRALGEAPWFNIKDRDIATHLLRTEMLRRGHTLTQITAHLAQAQGVQCRVLPMSDQFVETRVHTREYGWLDFQEYFVRYRCQPTVLGLRYDGAEHAVLPPQVADALGAADVIVFAPSNPWLSIMPMLHVPGMREAITQSKAPRIAVTPIVEGRAIKGPAAKMMGEMGYEVSYVPVARFYADFVTTFVYDKRDAPRHLEAPRLVALDTIMNDEASKIRLAQEVLALGETA
ncbi:MAG: 2-phospho-L-lactate transferase [Anaerolineae bacterium]